MMARSVMILILIVVIAERSVIKNTHNLLEGNSTEANNIAETESKVQLEFKSLWEKVLELNKVSTQMNKSWGKVHVF